MLLLVVNLPALLLNAPLALLVRASYTFTTQQPKMSCDSFSSATVVVATACEVILDLLLEDSCVGAEGITESIESFSSKA